MMQQISLLSETLVSNSGSPNSQRLEVKTGRFRRSSQILTIYSVVPVSFECKTTKLICHLIIFLYLVSRISGRHSLFLVWYYQGRNLYWIQNVVSWIFHGFVIYFTKRRNIKLNTPRLHSSTFLQLHHSHPFCCYRQYKLRLDKLCYSMWQSTAVMSDSL